MNETGRSNSITAPYPWQAAAWEQLLQQLQDGKLPHALLLAGPQHPNGACAERGGHESEEGLRPRNSKYQITNLKQIQNPKFQ